MRIKTKFLIIIAFFLTIGCAGQYPSAKISGPFITYTHETFIQKESGETGLYIDGEEWYALINLKGFEDANMKFTSPYQFIWQKNRDEGIILSAFAEKIKEIKDSKSCLDRFAPNNAREKLGNKTVQVAKYNLMTSIHYRPYYEGYCFDFHFSAYNQEAINRIAEIIESVQFIDGSFSNVFLKKFIYYGDKRIQLLIPDDIDISYESGNSGSIPSIVLVPKNGNRFEMYVSLLMSKDGSPIPKKRVKEDAQLKLESAARTSVSEPKLLEITKKDTTVYYYVAEDKNYNYSDKNDYPFVCQGYAAVDGSVLYFTILHYKTEREITKQLLDIILNARILSL